LKEKIYTIPINDAFNADCSCAICEIENKLNNEIIESTLGASMMEPDFRITTNERGFCKQHYSELLSQGKALPLSLILQTHSQTQNEKFTKLLKAEAHGKKGLFKKTSGTKEIAQNTIDEMQNLEKSCAVCERRLHLLDKYLINVIYLWKTEKDFKLKFNSKDGFCLPHFAKLLQYGINHLSDKDFEDFYSTITVMQNKSLNQTYRDISDFTKLFDYKSDGNASDNVKNAIKRTIHKYSGVEY